MNLCVLSVKPAHRLTLFYLCNDVVQTCKRKKALIFIDSFKPLLRQATALVRWDCTVLLNLYIDLCPTYVSYRPAEVECWFWLS